MKNKYALLKNTIGANGYWQVNKKLARELGHLPALLLAHFIDILANYDNMPDEFYQQTHRIKNDLAFSDRDLSNSIHALKNAGILNVVKKGLPAKNYYSLNEDKIVEILSDQTPLTTKCSHYKLQNVASGDVKMNSQKQINNKDKETIKDKKTRHLDTLEAHAKQDTQESASAEYTSQASVSSSEAKASSGVDDFDFDLEYGIVEKQVAQSTQAPNSSLQDISLVEVIESEANLEIKTSASGRENIKINQTPAPVYSTEVDSSMLPYVEKRKDITHYKAIAEYAKPDYVGQVIDESSFKQSILWIPVDQLPDLTFENIQNKVYSWKNQYGRVLLHDKKILIKKIAFVFNDSEGNQVTSKFYA